MKYIELYLCTERYHANMCCIVSVNNNMNRLVINMLQEGKDKAFLLRLLQQASQSMAHNPPSAQDYARYPITPASEFLPSAITRFICSLFQTVFYIIDSTI